MRCSDGQMRWGLFGAAGVVFVTAREEALPLVMLQLRSGWSHEGGTWSCPGPPNATGFPVSRFVATR